MVEWWNDLGSSDRALVVSASGIVLAAATFIWNQCHQVFERRRERMVRVLLSMTNAVLPPEASPQEILNVDVIPAFPEAYLGLSGKSAAIARDAFRAMGPEGPDFSSHKEYAEHQDKLLSALAHDLWKRVHPIRRLVSEPPPYYAWKQSQKNPNKVLH